MLVAQFVLVEHGVAVGTQQRSRLATAPGRARLVRRRALVRRGRVGRALSGAWAASRPHRGIAEARGGGAGRQAWARDRRACSRPPAAPSGPGRAACAFRAARRPAPTAARARAPPILAPLTRAPAGLRGCPTAGPRDPCPGWAARRRPAEGSTALQPATALDVDGRRARAGRRQWALRGRPGCNIARVPYAPCPAGWRVAGQAEAAALWSPLSSHAPLFSSHCARLHPAPLRSPSPTAARPPRPHHAGARAPIQPVLQQRQVCGHPRPRPSRTRPGLLGRPCTAPPRPPRPSRRNVWLTRRRRAPCSARLAAAPRPAARAVRNRPIALRTLAAVKPPQASGTRRLLCVPAGACSSASPHPGSFRLPTARRA